MRGYKFTFGQLMVIITLVILAVLTLLPFYMTLMISQKTNGEILNHFWAWPREYHPEYFTKAFLFIKHYMLNSVTTGAISIIGSVFLSSLAGYVFARLEFGGKNVLYMLILALMMIPGLLTLVPAFLWYKEFPLVGGNNWLGIGGSGFLDTRWAVIIAAISGGQVFGTFLCRTFFESIPSSLFESARMDGASEFQCYYKLALPLSLPILATLAIMGFVGVYNDYIWPLITIGNDKIQLFSVGVTKFGAEGNLDQGPMMAGYLIGALPLILLFAVGMKFYVEGLTRGAVKS